MGQLTTDEVWEIREQAVACWTRHMPPTTRKGDYAARLLANERDVKIIRLTDALLAERGIVWRRGEIVSFDKGVDTMDALARRLGQR